MGLSYARCPAGEPIAECELEPGDIGLLAALSQEAKRHGASYLCVYCTADLTDAGFERRQGYRRFTASHALAAKPLPVLEAAAVREVWPWPDRSVLGRVAHVLTVSVNIWLRNGTWTLWMCWRTLPGGGSSRSSPTASAAPVR